MDLFFTPPLLKYPDRYNYHSDIFPYSREYSTTESSSLRAFAARALFQKTQQIYCSTIDVLPIPHSIASFATQITVGGDVPNAGTAFGDGCCESLLLPGVFFRYVFDSRESKLGSSIFQMFAAQEINAWTGIGIDK